MLGEVVAWARDKWPGRFTDLPAMFSESVHERMVCRDDTDAVVLPATLEKRLALIEQQQRKIRDLEQALQCHV